MRNTDSLRSLTAGSQFMKGGGGEEHPSEIVKWSGGHLYQKGFRTKAFNSRPISLSSDPSSNLSCCVILGRL